MSINPDLMVISPNLQEIFLDKDTGLPLVGGNVFYYADDSRSDLKTVYELSGDATSGYTYTALPNPVPLSVSGSPINGSLQDIRIYYYPYDAEGNPQKYYIVVKSATAVTQLIRQDWPPPVGGTDPTPTSSAYMYNFVRNGTFFSWSNGTSFANVGLGSTDYLDFMPDDWTYEQNDATQVVAISRGTFTLGSSVITGDNPPYYFIYTNSNAGSGLGTTNRLRQRYKSVQTLSDKEVTVSLWLMKTTPSAVVDMSVSVTQFYGTGGSPATTLDTLGFTIPGSAITNTWTKFSATFSIPAVAGNPGTDNNDALFLNINFPLNSVQTVSVEKVIMQQGSATATATQELSNDDISQNTDVIGLYPAFTTGDIKPTIKTVSDPGWLLMDDTTIGSPLSGATHTGFKYYSLFNLIWTNIHSSIWAPIFTSAGVITTYGGTSVSDWAANTRLSLTKILGRALSGSGQSIIIKAFTANSATNVITIDNTSSFLVGTPVTFSAGVGGTLPSGLAALTTYYVTGVTGTAITSTTFKLSSTLALAIGGTSDIAVVTTGTSPIFVTTTLASQVLGSYFGEYNHALTIAEIPSHTHELRFNQIESDGSGNNTFQAGAGTLYNPAQTGGSTAHNIVQPTAFLNVMIKL